MSPTLSSYQRDAGNTADALLEKLDDPEIVRALISLLDKSTKLAAFADLLEGFVQRSEGILESVSRNVSHLGRAGTDVLKQSLEKLDLDDLKSASQQIRGLLPLVRDVSREFGALKEAGLFDRDVLQILGRAGRALSTTVRDPKAHSTDARGIFSLVGLLKDPEIARTINFLVSFAHNFGGDLNSTDSNSTRNTPPAAASTTLLGRRR